MLKAKHSATTHLCRSEALMVGQMMENKADIKNMWHNETGTWITE